MKKFKDITIVIDPGHGGKDPGGVGNGLKEKDLTLAIALLLGAILKAFGINIIYTRTTDAYVSLSTRAKIANDAKADLFISIHINAGGGITVNGVEIFSHPNSAKGMILSKDILNQILLDNLFKTNRGNKTANFAVLRLTHMPAVLTETGFIDHAGDAQILRNKQKEIAESLSRGILKFLGIRDNGPKVTKVTNIISKPTGTIKQMQEWAKRKKAHPKFIELAPLFYTISEEAGVDPIVTYTQSAKETGYMNFGGVLDISYNNPCGMKNSGGGGDYDPKAHKRFTNWEEGIQAQTDHLALYAGAKGYPKKDTMDPRHFPYLHGTSPTVEGLGGKWAPSKDYGTDIIKMMKELQGIKVAEGTKEDELDVIKILLHGQDIEVEGIRTDNTNYVSIRFLEQLGYGVNWKDGKVHINYRKD